MTLVRHDRSFLLVLSKDAGEGGTDTVSTLKRGDALALAAISTADFLVVMEGFIVAVALPSVQRDLGLDQAGLQWVFTAYALTFGGFLLLGGRLGDLYGRRRVLVCGLMCFAVGSTLAGTASTGPTLIGGRAVQGLGAAAMTPSALALLAARFPAGRARNIALAVWSAVGSIGIPAGALIGGIVTETVGWRWVLLINVPAALVAAALARAVLADSRDPAVVGRDGAARLDVTGAVLVTTGLALLIAAVTSSEQLAATYIDATAGRTLSTIMLRLAAPLLLAAALLVGFVVVERRLDQRAAAPLVPLSALRTPGLIAADVTAAALPVGLGALLFLGTQFLQQVLGFTPWHTAMAYLTLALPTVAASPVAAALLRRLARRRVAVGGLLLQAAGLLWLCFTMTVTASAPSGGLTSRTFIAGVLPAFLLVGAGAPIAFVPVTGAAVDDAGPAGGVASGLFNAAQQVGNALAIALMAAATAVGSTLMSSSPEAGTATQAGLRSGLIVATALCVMAILPAHRLSRDATVRPASSPAGIKGDGSAGTRRRRQRSQRGV